MKVEEQDPVLKDIMDREKKEEEHLELQKLNEQRKKAMGIDSDDNEKNKDNKDDKNKSKKFTAKHMFIFLIIAVLAASVYFYFDNIKEETFVTATGATVEKVNNNYYIYNSFEFYQGEDGTWGTELLNPETNTVFVVALHNDPLSVEDVEVSGEVRAWLNDAIQYKTNDSDLGATYILFDPDVNSSQQALAYGELQRNLDRGLRITPYAAVTKDFEENEFGLPIKTCPSKEPTIYLKYNSPTYVFRQGNCLIVQGMEEEMVRAQNRMLYLLYGIMRD